MSRSQSAVALARKPRRLIPTPRQVYVRPGDIIGLVAFNGFLLLAMWIRHGQIDGLRSTAGILTAGGEITALMGTYAALLQLLIMSRTPGLEQHLGMDRLARWHRWLGITCVYLICAHVVLSTAGYAAGDGSSVWSEAWHLVTTYPYMLPAAASTGLFVMVGFTSMRWARRRLKHETWHFFHLYGYLAVVLAFGHEVVVGSDFDADPWARGYWIALSLVVAALILAFRVGNPLRMGVRHRWQVDRVVSEGLDTVSVYVSGRELHRLNARAGQYFVWRFLARDRWWRAHPYSLSAAPNDQYLRITVKAVGDGSEQVQNLRPGTRCLVEGPYGVFTSERRSRGKVLLIAAGIGITPIRALLEELPGGKDAIRVLYRASSWEHAVLRDEVDGLVRDRRGSVDYLIGSRSEYGNAADPLSAESLRRQVPDIRGRDVYICGPAQLMRSVGHALRTLGVPPGQIHFERFALL